MKTTFRSFLLLFLFSCAIYSFQEKPYIGYSDYQIITDTRFDVNAYFETMQADGVNLQRIWVLGYSNTSSFRERMPFRKVGRKYNLEELDPVYLKRLQSIIAMAQQYDQRVLLTLFDRWSMTDIAKFVRTPWYYENNTNKLLMNPFPEFYDLSNQKLVAVQKNLVQTIVRTTAEYKPIYEIMNEARWSDCKTLLNWHRQVAEWILELDPGATIAVNIGSNCPSILKADWVDLISLHGTQWLESGICETVEKYRNFDKPILIDTDGVFKQRVDNHLVKEWLKEALECGASFNHKDDIYRLDVEALTIFKEERDRFNNKSSKPPVE
jgi:hypothetical protein